MTRLRTSWASRSGTFHTHPVSVGSGQAHSSRVTSPRLPPSPSPARLRPPSSCTEDWQLGVLRSLPNPAVIQTASASFPSVRSCCSLYSPASSGSPSHRRQISKVLTMVQSILYSSSDLVHCHCSFRCAALASSPLQSGLCGDVSSASGFLIQHHILSLLRCPL